MKLWALSSGIVLGLVLLGGRAVAAEPKLLLISEFIERDDPETQTSVPESIQKDMFQSACKFMERVYPDIDKDWMQKEFAKILLKDRYELLQLHNPWPPMVRIRSGLVVQMEIAFPHCQIIQVAANRAPPGVVPEELGKPLALQGAESRAQSALERLVGGPEEARRFRVNRFRRGAIGLGRFSFRPVWAVLGPPRLDGCLLACLQIQWIR